MVLPIVRYPNPVLRARCRPIETIEERHRQLAVDMIETMRAANGVGLAGPQVDVDERIAVVDVSHDPECISYLRINGEDADLKASMPMVFLNPEVKGKKIKERGEEGCLSLPDLRGKVQRPAAITVTFQNLDGETVRVETDGLLARAFQHEIDHLNGILFIDRLSPASKMGVMRRLKWLMEEWEEDDRKAERIAARNAKKQQENDPA